MTVTRIVANVWTSESVTYHLEGEVDIDRAFDLIQSGEYEPVESNIRSEDVDIVVLEIIEGEIG